MRTLRHVTLRYVRVENRHYVTLRYGTLRIETYGSTLRYGFSRYVTLRYVRVENTHYASQLAWQLIFEQVITYGVNSAGRF